MRGNVVEIFPVVFYFTAVYWQQTRQSFERGSFARAVAADERDQFAGRDVERDAFDRAYTAVAYVQILDLQYRFSHRPLPDRQRLQREDGAHFSARLRQFFCRSPTPRRGRTA